jgi:DNA primase
MLTDIEIAALKKKPRRLWTASEVVEVLSMASNWYRHETSLSHAVKHWKDRALSAEHERDALMQKLDNDSFLIG